MVEFVSANPTGPLHLAAGAGKSFDRALRMLNARRVDAVGDAEPITHRGDLTERNAGLYHTERTGVHSYQEDLCLTAAIAIEVLPVRFEGVVEWVVDVMDRRGECAPPSSTAERTRDVCW